MLERSLKLVAISFAAVSLVACSSMSGGKKDASASDKTESAEKALESSMCKGKVNASGLKKLTDFVSDPTAFFCNANWRMTLAVERQYAAYGDSEKAAKAKQAREKIENGTYGPAANKALQVSLSPTDEEKSRYAKAVMDDSSGKTRKAYEEGRSEVKAAAGEVAIGTASLALQINSAVQAVKTAKEKQGDTFAQIAAIAQVAKTTADVIQTVTLLNSFKDSVNQYNLNNEFMDRAIGAAEGDKPSLEGATDLASLATF
jgi:hypothetical protein